MARAESVMHMPVEEHPVQFLKPSVLVVDDEKRIRDVCIKMLSNEGHEAEGAESAQASMQMIQEKHFDIILMDLMMPGLPGLDALAQIRALHPDTVVVVITGYATLKNAVEAMKKGAFDFIAKPFAPDDLRIVIAKAATHIRTLQDIANEKSRMRAMINHLTDGVMTTDIQQRIAQVNPAFLRLIGYHGPRPIGQEAAQILGNETIGTMIDRVLDAPESDCTEVSEELCLDTVAHAKVIVLAHCMPFQDRLGRNLGTITVLHDITAQKAMDQVKSDFVSMVSHEIRSPMNSVLMQLKVVMDGLAGETTGKQREVLGRASEKIAGLIDMATNLLDLAKLESGLITQEREAVQIVALIKEQVAFHQPRAEEKSIRLSLENCPVIPAVWANSFNLEEVFSNLIGNAINYTPEGGTITILVAVEGEYVVVRIKDTGLGISEDDLPRIFNRFYRVKNANTRHIIGTGLGLPIVKSILDSINGLIRVESRLGIGTTFSVYFPISNQREGCCHPSL